MVPRNDRLSEQKMSCNAEVPLTKTGLLAQSPIRFYTGGGGGVMKPFPKTPRKVITLTIDENGDQIFLKTDTADIFLELGEVITRRASHVFPVNFWKRQAFRVLRILGDTGRIAAWSRTWRGPWLVDTSPVGGPILTWGHLDGGDDRRVATFYSRQNAIDHEIKFLNNFFAERTI